MMVYVFPLLPPPYLGLLSTSPTVFLEHQPKHSGPPPSDGAASRRSPLATPFPFSPSSFPTPSAPRHPSLDWCSVDGSERRKRLAWQKPRRAHCVWRADRSRQRLIRDDLTACLLVLHIFYYFSVSCLRRLRFAMTSSTTPPRCGTRAYSS